MIQSRMRYTSTQGKVVEALKKMLISRDTKIQLKAVCFMNTTLQKIENENEVYKAVVEHFLSSDLCIFLCEASATLQVPLLKNIIICLRKFSTFKMFYNNSYAPAVVSSVSRTIHFILKETVMENIIQHGLYLMSEIFFQVDTFKLSGVLSYKSSYNAHQLLELLFELLDNANLETNTTLATSLVLHSILIQKNYKTNVNRKTLNYASDIIKKCIEVLSDSIVENHFKCNSENKTHYVFGMLCHITIDALNFSKICEHYYCHNNLNNDYTENEIEEIQSVVRCQESIIQSVHKMLTGIASQLKNFDYAVVAPNIDVFFELLNIFLNDNTIQDILPVFVKHLYKNDFLTILHKHMSSRKTPRNCPNIISKILFVLSLESFNFNNWKGGSKAFEKHLYEGLIEMKSTETWIHKLNDSHTSDATINAILSYYYFVCLNSEDPENETSVLYENLLEFILSIPNRTRCPDPTTKCLWLIFAMAGISIHRYPLPIEEIIKFGKATEKIVYFISLNMKELYTHHPTMIYWAFASNRIPRRIQKCMLSFWLEKEEKLPNNLGSKCTVWSSLVELIQDGPPNVLKSATDQLKYCIDTYCDEESANDISTILWNALPETLSAFAVGRIDVPDVTLHHILDLCSNYIPANPSPSAIQRSASLLVSILTSRKQDCIHIHMPLTSGAFSLLNTSLKYDDTIVLSQFINSPALLHFLYEASQSDDIQLSTSALMMLSFSSYYKAKYGLQCDNRIEFQPSSIITSLKMEKDNKKLVAIMQLLHTMLIPKQCISSLIVIATQYPKSKYINTFKALFFRLQMVCCKESKVESHSALSCLNDMLQYARQSDVDSQLMVTLSQQPWTLILIRFFLYQKTPSKINKKFLKFVLNWLNCIREIVTSENCSEDVKQSFHFSEYSPISSSFSYLVGALKKDDVLNSLDLERKEMVDNILQIISSFFDDCQK